VPQIINYLIKCVEEHHFSNIFSETRVDEKYFDLEYGKRSISEVE
jgi:hypothetical protein